MDCIISTSIRFNYFNLLVGMLALGEVVAMVLAVVVDTPVEMDRPVIIFLVVEEDHSISIQMEQKQLDGSKMENVKLN